MTNFSALLLGVIQGITEFLPISSDGHLALVSLFLGINNPSLFFIITVHIATLLVTIMYFRKQLLHLFIGLLSLEKTALKQAILVVIGTLPAVAAGLLIIDSIETAFASLLITGLGFAMTATMLFLLHTQEKLDEREQTHYTFHEKLKIMDAFLIGSAQALALLPGVSRSGMTITTARLRGLTITDAFDFSFLLSLPAITGALLLEIIKNPAISIDQYSVIGGGSAALVGWFALRFLKKTLIQKKVLPFSIYCFILAFLSILVFFM